MCGNNLIKEKNRRIVTQRGNCLRADISISMALTQIWEYYIVKMFQKHIKKKKNNFHELNAVNSQFKQLLLRSSIIFFLPGWMRRTSPSCLATLSFQVFVLFAARSSFLDTSWVRQRESERGNEWNQTWMLSWCKRGEEINEMEDILTQLIQQGVQLLMWLTMILLP